MDGKFMRRTVKYMAIRRFTLLRVISFSLACLTLVFYSHEPVVASQYGFCGPSEIKIGFPKLDSKTGHADYEIIFKLEESCDLVVNQHSSWKIETITVLTHDKNIPIPLECLPEKSIEPSSIKIEKSPDDLDGALFFTFLEDGRKEDTGIYILNDKGGKTVHCINGRSEK